LNYTRFKKTGLNLIEPHNFFTFFLKLCPADILTVFLKLLVRVLAYFYYTQLTQQFGLLSSTNTKSCIFP